ncbi:teicoplanin resistance protein VanZ [Chryseobacterium sp. Leaf404]|uniref:VanZ family protein n=1 Tax=unclassified Chryseobacterium TaxID=2593645 RepID=UPI0006F229C1|nr:MULTISPECIES: VanZ family protein [unclassified Chryseobacterium]KQT16360.1 teicoplanin resistance protein VanZ [Chryseobacterium sp. Leaf404]
MLKKFYQITIFPYTLFLLYLMFLGMGRFQFEVNVIRIEPVFSTVKFIENTIRWWDIVRIVLGNVLMFIPFGFLGWVFPKLQDLKCLMYTFISSIVIIEGMQYFTRLGIFEIDDILLNSFGVFIGYQIHKVIENKLSV